MAPAALLENPAWHIHAGAVPVIERADLGFAMLLNLASVCNAEDKSVLWGFIRRYAPEATPATEPLLDSLVGYELNYYRDFVNSEARLVGKRWVSRSRSRWSPCKSKNNKKSYKQIIQVDD